MNLRISDQSRTRGRTIWGVLGFLFLFAILVLMVVKFYLIPGLKRPGMLRMSSAARWLPNHCC